MHFFTNIRNCWLVLFLLFFQVESSAQCFDVKIGIIIDTIANPCDGPVTLDAQIPGAIYKWNTGDTTQKIKVTLTGLYTVTVQKDGCTDRDTTTVTYTEPPLFDLGASKEAFCGGCITLDASGSATGKTYQWSTGETTEKIQVCQTGSFKIWVDVFSASGCKTSDTVQVKINPGLEPDLGNDTTLCADSLVLTADIGNTFHWNTGAVTKSIAVYSSAEYIVEVKDNKGCTGMDTIKVILNHPPVADLGSDPLPICGGCLTLSPASSASGNTYHWSTGETSATIQVCQTGSQKIWVDVFSAEGCKKSDTVQVKVNPGIEPDLGNDTTLCADSLVLTATIGKTFHWNTGAVTKSIVVYNSADYIVEVKDAKGCIGSDTIKVILKKPAVADLGPDPKPICGGCVTLDAGENYPFILWSTGEKTQKINFCTPGISKIKVTVGTAENCFASDSVIANITKGPDLFLGDDIIQCGGSVKLKSNIQPAKYSWNTLDTTSELTVKQSGNYILDITDAKGCKASDTIAVTINEVPVFELGTPQTQCGGCITLSAENNIAANYLWSTGETTAVIEYCRSGETKIWARATSMAGCEFSDTAAINIKPGYMVNLGNDTAVCGGQITLNPGFTGSSFLWNTGATTQSITVNNSGIYKVKIYNLSDCSKKDTISGEILITFGPELLAPASISDLSSNCLNRILQVSKVTGADSYTWTVPAGWQIVNGQGTEMVDILPPGINQPGVVSVSAANAAGCISASRDTVIQAPDVTVFIPNAFSPDNDGINDVWVIRNIEYSPQNELAVLNRWGNEVFRQTSYRSNWTGDGLNEGTYFYQLKVTECAGEKEYKGNVTILRR